MIDWDDSSEFSYTDEEEEYEKKEEAKGPFELETLDVNLINKIVEKMYYTEFSRFEEVSKLTAAFCQNLPTTIPKQIGTIFINEANVKINMGTFWEDEAELTRRIPWHVAIAGGAQIRSHMLKIPYRATSKRLRAVTRLFKKNRTVIHDMILTERILFDLESLEELIKITGIGFIKSYQYFPREFFTQKLFDHLSNIDLGSTGFTDDEFLALKWDGELRCTNDFITARGLNKFLKQWKRKQREIGTVCIQFDGSFNTRPFELILEGLDANPIWSQALHKDSIISKLPIEEYPPMESGDPFEYYSIWRSDDCFDSVQVIHLSMGEFQIWGAENEAEYVLDELSEDQFYFTMGICRHCYRDPCRHRRKYSTNRLKIKFSRLWKGIMAAFSIGKWTAILSRYGQILLGAPRLAQSPSQEEIFRYFLEENPHHNQVLRYWLLLELYLFHN